MSETPQDDEPNGALISQPLGPLVGAGGQGGVRQVSRLQASFPHTSANTALRGLLRVATPHAGPPEGWKTWKAALWATQEPLTSTGICGRLAFLGVLLLLHGRPLPTLHLRHEVWFGNCIVWAEGRKEGMLCGEVVKVSPV